MEPAAELAPGPTDGRSLVSVAGDPSGAAGRPKITRWPLFSAESTNDGRAGSGVFTTGPRGAGANGEITPPCLDLVGLPAPKSLAFFSLPKIGLLFIAIYQLEMGNSALKHVCIHSLTSL